MVSHALKHKKAIQAEMQRREDNENERLRQEAEAARAKARRQERRSLLQLLLRLVPGFAIGLELRLVLSFGLLPLGLLPHSLPPGRAAAAAAAAGQQPVAARAAASATRGKQRLQKTVNRDFD